MNRTAVILYPVQPPKYGWWVQRAVAANDVGQPQPQQPSPAIPARRWLVAALCRISVGKIPHLLLSALMVYLIQFFIRSLS